MTNTTLSLSLSLTHTHTYIYIYDLIQPFFHLSPLKTPLFSGKDGFKHSSLLLLLSGRPLSRSPEVPVAGEVLPEHR